MNRIKNILMVLSIATLLPSVSSAEDDDAAELKRVEGRFERPFTNAAGTVFRTVKDVAAGKSVVTTYDDAGNVIESHHSEYTIKRHGPLRVFSFFNLVVTAGANKGHTQLGTTAFVYRSDGDTVIEAWGLLENDPSPPRMFTWQRVKTP